MSEQHHPAAVNGEDPKPKYEDLAGILDHLLLRAEMSEEGLQQGCALARRYGVATVIVRPSDLDFAARIVVGVNPSLGSVVDFPLGHSTTAVKTFAVRDVLRRGAKEVDTVMNTGKLISRNFQYLEVELAQMADACHQSGAKLKVMVESQYLNEELKLLACRISKRAAVDYVGCAAVEDLPLFKEYSRGGFKLMIAGSVESLDEALALRDAGCDRLQSENTAVILDSWKARVSEGTGQSAVIS